MSYLPSSDEEPDSGLLKEEDVYRKYEIDPNAFYTLAEVKKKTGVDWIPLTNWAGAHKAWRGHWLSACQIPGDALVLYLRLQRWKEVKERNRLLGLRPPEPIPIPQRYETSVQRARREQGSAYKSGRKSRAQKEKEVEDVFGTKAQILAKMTEPLWALARKHQIIPEKSYETWELAKKHGVSKVKFWSDYRRKIKRHQFGKYYRVLGLNYLDFLARQDAPAEIARLTPKEAAKSVRQQRSHWPPLTPPERRIARERKIRPTQKYGLPEASRLTGFPIPTIHKWASRLRLVERPTGEKSYIFGRDLLFFVYERRWREEAKVRSEAGESVHRYPLDTPERYQTDGYKTQLYSIESRKNEERRVIEEREKAAAKAEKDRRRIKEAERLKALRRERSFSPEPLTKDRYTLKEVAMLARRRKKTIERWVKMGHVKKIKVGINVFIEREEVLRIQSANGKPWPS